MSRPLAARTLPAAALVACLTLPAAAEKGCEEDAMIVFDGSGSMGEINSDITRSRIAEARDAVRDAMPMIAPFRRVGLIVFGPTITTEDGTANNQTSSNSRCENISLHFAPERDAGLRVIDSVNNVRPRGETPLTDAVARAAQVLNYTERPALIVLVADGKETCGGSPCHLAGELAANAHDLTVHVIGFKVRRGLTNWNDKVEDSGTVAECLAVANGGKYVPAESVEDLASALEDTLSCNSLSRAPSALPPPRAG